MKIAILDLCIWLPEYQHDQARFGDLLADWLRRGLPEAELSVLNIVDGAPLPEPDSYDGYVISGSEQGVYDSPHWMDALRAFLPKVKEGGIPMFGVCFGHQILADVFGGKAEKVSDKAVGVRKFELNGQVQTGHVWHGDQVTKVPPGATVIGSADYCPVAALAYDFPAMSVQFHPEYPPDYVSTFIERSKGDVLDEAAAEAAVEAFNNSDVSPDLFARQAAEFFREHLNA